MLFTHLHEDILKQEIRAIFDSTDKVQAISKLKTKLMTLNTIDGGTYEMSCVGEYLDTCLLYSPEPEKALFAPVLRLIDIHKMPHPYLKCTDHKTPLHLIFEVGDMDAFQLLQVYEANILKEINAPQDKEKNTLLHLATKAGNLQMVKDLVEIGWADVNAKNEDRETALDLAVQNGDAELVAYLLENIANAKLKGYTSYDANSLLHMAVREKKIEICRQLLRHMKAHNLNINAPGEDEKTALHLAVLAGNLDLINLLLENGADVAAQDKNGATPLHDAALVGDIAICRRLVDAGADVHARSRIYGFPLNRAVMSENFKVMVDWFIDECGVDINACDKTQATEETALYLVREIPEKSAYLLAKGADPNIADKFGNTPLHHLMSTGLFTEEAKVLLRGGARVDIKNKPPESDSDDEQNEQENAPPPNGQAPLNMANKGSPSWTLLKNFSKDKTIIQAMYQIAKPIFIEGLFDGLLISVLEKIVYEYFELPEGKVIEVAEQCLFGFAKKTLPMRQEKEVLEKQRAEEKSEHGKASLKARVEELNLEINRLTEAAANIISLVPLPDDCAEYWYMLQTKNTESALEKVQRPSKLPKLISSKAPREEKEREEKHSQPSFSKPSKMEVDDVPLKSETSTDFLGKEEEKPRATRAVNMDVDPDSAMRLSPGLIQVSTPFSTSSSSSSSSISLDDPTPWYWKIDARAKPEPKQEDILQRGKRKREGEQESEAESSSSAKAEDKQLTPTTGRKLGAMQMSFFVAQQIKKQGGKKAKKVEVHKGTGSREQVAGRRSGDEVRRVDKGAK